MFKVIIKRNFTQERNQSKGVEFLKRRILSSRPSWECTETEAFTPYVDDARFYVYRYCLTFEKTSGQQATAQKEWSLILENLVRVGGASKFKPCIWTVEQQEQLADLEPEPTTGNGNTKHAMSENIGTTLQTVKERALEKVIELLTEKDAIKNSEYFRGIFEREPQIRTILSSVKSFLETDGERRNHILLYGLPACAKTQILNAVTELLGSDAIVRLDGTSTTPAGIYKVYFEQFDELPEPPFVILEEAEKTAEESLRVWLGALDDRGELRKVNYRDQKQRNLKILCMATANDKEIFDKLMGGTEKLPGALSSRFAHQLQCPRPDAKVLRLILERDIEKKGGSTTWIDPVLELAKQTGTDDPRKVLAYLDGGNRLITGDYQKDILAIFSNGVGTLDI